MILKRFALATIIILNKPYDVLCQFTDKEHGRTTLKQFVDITGVYPAGRLDRDSEGLVLLTDDGRLQAQISSPKFKLPKTYHVQVEGTPTRSALDKMETGLDLKDGKTLPITARIISPPSSWSRTPAVTKKDTSWLELTLREGRNRQVRRMTAHIGHPTLRLIRVSIGPWSIGSLLPGRYREEKVFSQAANHKNKPRRRSQTNKHSNNSKK